MSIINMSKENREMVSKIVIGGYYRHYKGGLYQITGYCTHTETEEVLVLYRSLGKDESTLWARPITMWLENVEKNGKEMPRFTYEGNSYLAIIEKEIDGNGRFNRNS